jgi:hypothetical protein
LYYVGQIDDLGIHVGPIHPDEGSTLLPLSLLIVMAHQIFAYMACMIVVMILSL